MNIRRLTPLLACLAALASARAAAPTAQALQIGSVILGQAATLQGSVADPDGDLLTATFLVSGPAGRDPLHPGVVTWPTAQVIGTVNVSGAQASPQFAWQPPAAGTYMVWVRATDAAANTTTSAAGTFECVTGRLTVPAQTVSAPANLIVTNGGEILSTENVTATTTLVQNGAALIFWSGGRVALKPGFRAADGAFFWAAVDHDQNGYSDVEESTDSDGDGLPDAWEVDHGLNPFDPSDAAHIVVGSSQTYLQWYQSGHNVVPTSGTGTFQLVLRTPANAFLGVNTTTWTIIGVP